MTQETLTRIVAVYDSKGRHLGNEELVLPIDTPSTEVQRVIDEKYDFAMLKVGARDLLPYEYGEG